MIVTAVTSVGPGANNSNELAGIGVSSGSLKSTMISVSTATLVALIAGDRAVIVGAVVSAGGGAASVVNPN